MNSGLYMEEENSMSMLIEICKYDKGIMYGELLMNKRISTEELYYKYLAPAIKELNIQYFRNDGEIRKCNQEAAMRELELLIEWVEKHVEGKDLDYLQSRLRNVQKVIPESLQEEDDILYIF